MLPSDEINNLQHASPTVLKLAVLKTSKNFKFFMYFHEQIIFQFHTTSVQSVICRLNTGMLIAIYERPFQLFCMIQSDSSDPQRLMFFPLGWFFIFHRSNFFTFRTIGESGLKKKQNGLHAWWIRLFDNFDKTQIRVRSCSRFSKILCSLFTFWTRD